MFGAYNNIIGVSSQHYKVIYYGFIKVSSQPYVRFPKAFSRLVLRPLLISKETFNRQKWDPIKPLRRIFKLDLETLLKWRVAAYGIILVHY
jgi:hypothetical protein